jgi:uncharacterized protein with HEPN domain
VKHSDLCKAEIAPTSTATVSWCWRWSKAIEIIGEAAFQTSESTRAQVPEIPWEDIVGMRHRLVHAYFDINLDVLWKTVQGDMVPLISRLEQVLGTKRI